MKAPEGWPYPDRMAAAREADHCRRFLSAAFPTSYSVMVERTGTTFVARVSTPVIGSAYRGGVQGKLFLASGRLVAAKILETIENEMREQARYLSGIRSRLLADDRGGLGGDSLLEDRL